MCDYSLEMYHSQPARESVGYKTHRFPTGSIGLVAPGKPDTAICVQCGMQLVIEGVPEALRREQGFEARETVVFDRIDSGVHHDAIRFANGAVVSLQRLGAGVDIMVTNALVPAAPELEGGKEAELETGLPA